MSGIIRADQLSRSTQAQISGTVDIIGNTQRFQSYPAYEQLKNEFDEMGVSVSDYALVMDKYEFSLKDLLERGPGRLDPSPSRRRFWKETFAATTPGGHAGHCGHGPSSKRRRARRRSRARKRLRAGDRGAAGRLRAAEADDVR